MWNGEKEKCKARKTLKNEALVAKIGVDTAEKGSENLKMRKKTSTNLP